LLYAMMLPSANDAALTVAQNYPGGVNAFVQKMNEKVQLFHLANSHYADPVGLNDDEDYTTVHDLSVILTYALSHPLLSQMMDTKYKTIYSVSGKAYNLTTTNDLLGQYGVYGGKTGYTEEAGEVLVTSTKMNDGHTYIIVVMKSDDRFGDTQKLLQLINDNIVYQQIHP
jgi:D-alanyl-D-alanine carboxypeptidase (penicillin-binding protein 5/6)